MRPVWLHSYANADGDCNAHSHSNGDGHTHSYANAHAGGNSDSYSYGNSNTYRDSNANTYTYADPMHWEMCTHAEAAPDFGGATHSAPSLNTAAYCFTERDPGTATVDALL